MKTNIYIPLVLSTMGSVYAVPVAFTMPAVITRIFGGAKVPAVVPGPGVSITRPLLSSQHAPSAAVQPASPRAPVASFVDGPTAPPPSARSVPGLSDGATITSPPVRTNSLADGNAPPVSPSASQAGLNNAAGDAPPPASGTTDATKKKFLETGLGQFTMFAGVSALAVAPGVIIQSVQGNKGLKQSKEQGDASLDLQKSQAEDAKKANEEAIAAQKAAMEG